MDIDLQKNWWIVNVAAGVVGVLVMILAEQFFPSLDDYATILFLTLVGLSFLWVFNTKKEIWWAVAPGVGALALAVASVANLIIGENNGWLASVIIGIGFLLMAVIPNPRAEILPIGYIGAIFALVIGLLMAPITIPWKIIFCLASALIVGYFAWRNREKLQQLQRA